LPRYPPQGSRLCDQQKEPTLQSTPRLILSLLKNNNAALFLNWGGIFFVLFQSRCSGYDGDLSINICRFIL